MGEGSLYQFWGDPLRAQLALKGATAPRTTRETIFDPELGERSIV
jgi:hypothetical protein